jgi:hypothetical protein
MLRLMRGIGNRMELVIAAKAGIQCGERCSISAGFPPARE